MSNLIRPYRIFDDFYRPFEGVFGKSLGPSAESARWLPPVDIVKNESEFVIEMEVPGFDRDQITVEAHDGVLSIEGERSVENATDEEGVVRRERQYGRFSRQFSLPDGTDPDNIAAVVKDGMLSIRIPHAAPRESKKIEIS